MKNTIRGISIGILLVIAISIYNSWRYSSTANGANTKTHSNGIYKIAIGKSPTKTFEIAGSNKENGRKKNRYIIFMRNTNWKSVRHYIPCTAHIKRS